jgi:hypothetical protein
MEKTAKQPIKGLSNYYRIIVHPREGPETTSILQRFSERVERRHQPWTTHAWLVSKNTAHIEGKYLVGDNTETKALLDRFASQPIRHKGDVFTAKHPNPTSTSHPEKRKVRKGRVNKNHPLII